MHRVSYLVILCTVSFFYKELNLISLYFSSFWEYVLRPLVTDKAFFILHYKKLVWAFFDCMRLLEKNNIDSSCLCFEPTFEPEYTLQLVLFFTKMQRLLHSNSCFVFLLVVLIDTDHLVTRETYSEAKWPCTKSSNAVTAMQRRERDTKRHWNLPSQQGVYWAREETHCGRLVWTQMVRKSCGEAILKFPSSNCCILFLLRWWFD